MALSSNINAFADCERAFRTALADPAGALQPIEGDSPEAIARGAARWRQRAYRYRELLRKAIREAYAGDPARAHLVGTTPYDTFILTLEPRGVRISKNDSSIGTPVGLSTAQPLLEETFDAAALDELLGPILDLEVK